MFIFNEYNRRCSDDSESTLRFVTDNPTPFPIPLRSIDDSQQPRSLSLELNDLLMHSTYFDSNYRCTLEASCGREAESHSRHTVAETPLPPVLCVECVREFINLIKDLYVYVFVY